MPTWQNFPKPLFFKRCFVKSVLALVRKHRDNERFKTTPLLGKKCERKKASVHSERGSARRWNLSSPTTLGLLLKLWELFSLNAIRAQVVIDGHKVSRLRSFSVLPLLSLDMMDVCFYVFYKLCPPVPWHFEDSFLFVFLSVFFFLSQCNLCGKLTGTRLLHGIDPVGMKEEAMCASLFEKLSDL